MVDIKEYLPKKEENVKPAGDLEETCNKEEVQTKTQPIVKISKIPKSEFAEEHGYARADHYR